MSKRRAEIIRESAPVVRIASEFGHQVNSSFTR
jgi:hypothetical protein